MPWPSNLACVARAKLDMRLAMSKIRFLTWAVDRAASVANCSQCSAITSKNLYLLQIFMAILSVGVGCTEH